MIKDLDMKNKQDRSLSWIDGEPSPSEEMLSSIVGAMECKNEAERKEKMKQTKMRSASWLQSGASLGTTCLVKVTRTVMKRM